MKNKTIFNNLFDSILILVVTVILILGYTMVLIFGVFNNQNQNMLISFIITTIVFGILIALAILLLILGCFERIVFDDTTISSKKIFRRKICIEFCKITEMTEKKIPALVLGVYKTEALVVKSGEKVIYVYLNKNKTIDDIKNMIKSDYR